MGDGGPETRLAELIRARDFGRAAAGTFETYGAEVYGFLVNEMGNETDAAEIFSATPAWLPIAR